MYILVEKSATGCLLPRHVEPSCGRPPSCDVLLLLVVVVVEVVVLIISISSSSSSNSMHVIIISIVHQYY